VNPLEADLSAYYDQEAGERAGRDLQPHRVEHRAAFLDLLVAEGRRRVVEIGTGPGVDAQAFLARGLAVSGVDLSAEHVRRAREAGVDAVVGSVLDLPYADGSFDAGWTMSTLLHVPDSHLDAALAEIVRVLAPGAPLAVGVWGGPDWEGSSDQDRFLPPRFFSLRSHERWRAALERHARVEEWDTWTLDGQSWTYQWAVLRRS
jgi:SAM-dependent methyltransferase